MLVGVLGRTPDGATAEWDAGDQSQRVSAMDGIASHVEVRNTGFSSQVRLLEGLSIVEAEWCIIQYSLGCR